MDLDVADELDHEKILEQCKDMVDDTIQDAMKNTSKEAAVSQLKFAVVYMNKQMKKYAEIQSKKLAELSRLKKKFREDLKAKEAELERNYVSLEKQLKQDMSKEKQMRRGEGRHSKKMLRIAHEEKEELQHKLRGIDRRYERKLGDQKRVLVECQKRNSELKLGLQNKDQLLEELKATAREVSDQNATFRAQITELIIAQSEDNSSFRTLETKLDEALRQLEAKENLLSQYSVNIASLYDSVEDLTKRNEMLFEDTLRLVEKLEDEQAQNLEFQDKLQEELQAVLQEKCELEAAYEKLLETTSDDETKRKSLEQEICKVSEEWRQVLDGVFADHNRELVQIKDEGEAKLLEAYEQMIAQEKNSELTVQGLQTAVENLQEEIMQLSEVNEDYVGQIHELSSENAALETKTTALEHENKLFQKTREDTDAMFKQQATRYDELLQKEQEKFQEIIENLQQRLADTQDLHKKAVDLQKQSYDDLLERRDRQATKEMASLKELYQEEIETLKQMQEQSLDSMKQQYETKKEEEEEQALRIKKLEGQLEELQAKYDTDVQQLKADFESKRAKYETDFQTLKTESEAEVQTLESEHKKELEKLRTDLISKLSTQEQQFAEEKLKLTEEVMGLEEWKTKCETLQERATKLGKANMNLLSKVQKAQIDEREMKLQIEAAEVETRKQNLELQDLCTRVGRAEQTGQEKTAEAKKIREKYVQCAGKIQAIAQEILLAKKELIIRDKHFTKTLAESRSQIDSLRKANRQLQRAHRERGQELQLTRSTLEFLTQPEGGYHNQNMMHSKKYILQLEDHYRETTEQNNDLMKQLVANKDKTQKLKEKLILTMEILATQKDQLALGAENNVRLKEKLIELQRQKKDN